MYADGNPKTKKLLKQRVTNWLLYPEQFRPVRAFSPGPFECPRNGTLVIEGPHYPELHRWYAQCRVEDGIIVHVK
jgi:hypothetical protein